MNRILHCWLHLKLFLDDWDAAQKLAEVGDPKAIQFFREARDSGKRGYDVMLALAKAGCAHDMAQALRRGRIRRKRNPRDMNNLKELEDTLRAISEVRLVDRAIIDELIEFTRTYEPSSDLRKQVVNTLYEFGAIQTLVDVVESEDTSSNDYKVAAILELECSGNPAVWTKLATWLADRNTSVAECAFFCLQRPRVHWAKTPEQKMLDALLRNQADSRKCDHSVAIKVLHHVMLRVGVRELKERAIQILEQLATEEALKVLKIYLKYLTEVRHKGWSRMDAIMAIAESRYVSGGPLEWETPQRACETLLRLADFEQADVMFHILPVEDHTPELRNRLTVATIQPLLVRAWDEMGSFVGNDVVAADDPLVTMFDDFGENDEPYTGYEVVAAYDLLVNTLEDGRKAVPDAVLEMIASREVKVFNVDITSAGVHHRSVRQIDTSELIGLAAKELKRRKTPTA